MPMSKSAHAGSLGGQDGDPRDDPDGTLGPDEQLLHVEPGVILPEPTSESVPDRAVGEDDL